MTGASDLGENWARLALKGTHQGFFKIRFQFILVRLTEKTDCKPSQILSHLVPIWLNFSPNMTSLTGRNTRWMFCCTNRQPGYSVRDPDTNSGLQGWQIWHPNWVRLTPNGTNLGLFKITFSTFWLVTSDSFDANLTQLETILTTLIR